MMSMRKDFRRQGIWTEWLKVQAIIFFLASKKVSQKQFSHFKPLEFDLWALSKILFYFFTFLWVLVIVESIWNSEAVFVISCTKWCRNIFREGNEIKFCNRMWLEKLPRVYISRIRIIIASNIQSCFCFSFSFAVDMWKYYIIGGWHIHKEIALCSRCLLKDAIFLVVSLGHHKNDDKDGGNLPTS